ncbi:MAG: hypothetical protein R2712_10515 [Vicinamibacterales bacterium]
MRTALGSLLAALMLLPGLSAQDRPLPDLQAFLAQVRTRLQPDESRTSGWVYVETRRERKLDASGRTTKETVEVFERYPGLPGEPRWERLISKDGVPVSDADLAKADRKRQQKAMDYARRLQREPARVQAEEARARDKERRELEASIDDALRIYDIRMLGRETIGGHGTIAFSFTPRPGVRPQTKEGKVIRHFAGKAWVSETEYELVRLEAEALDTVSFGLGLLARVHKGSKAEFERRKVNDEVWLPAFASYTASARVLLVRRLRIGGTSEYSDYRKFSVATETKVGGKKE